MLLQPVRQLLAGEITAALVEAHGGAGSRELAQQSLRLERRCPGRVDPPHIFDLEHGEGAEAYKTLAVVITQGPVLRVAESPHGDDGEFHSAGLRALGDVVVHWIGNRLDPRDLHPRRITPQSFQVVVATLALQEHMENDVAIVDQYPLSLLEPLL